MCKLVTLYIGSYTRIDENGINVWKLQRERRESVSVDGEKEVLNPSYLTVSSDRQYLYSVMEEMSYHGHSGGGIASFQWKGGQWKLVNTCGTQGTLPCHILLDEKRNFLFTSNYMSGSISMFPVENDGSIGELCDLKQHEGNGPNRERQEGPHVHFAGFSADGDGIWCVDLGIDTVKYYEIDEQQACLLPVPERDIHLPKGVGPRHFVLDPMKKNIMYLVTELSSEVFVIDCQSERNIILQRISSLPADTSESYCAAVKISDDGKYVYVSNRGHNSITIFEHESKKSCLVRKSTFGTGGKTPRDFAVCGSRIYVANQDSGNITVLEMDMEQVKLIKIEKSYKCNSPACVLADVFPE